MKYRKREEYVYKDLDMKMSTGQMSAVMYALIMTHSTITSTLTLSSGETRKINSRDTAWLKVHIHPEGIDVFNELSGLTLKEPPIITGA